MSSTRITPSDTYAQRFSRFNDISATGIKAIADTGKLAENFKLAGAVTETQQENVKKLMATAEEMIASINTFQQSADLALVRNIPMPSKEIRTSNGKSLGYIQLSIRFLASGMLHFMEQYHSAADRCEKLEKHIEMVASYNDEIAILGELESLDMRELEVEEEVTPPASPIKEQIKPTNPVTAHKAATVPEQTRPSTPAVAKKDTSPSSASSQKVSKRDSRK